MSPSRTKDKWAFNISFGGKAFAMEWGFSLRQERRRTKEKVDMVNHQGAIHLKDCTVYTYA